MSNDAGVLYVVATPIGNLADMTERALTVLGRVSVVLAEDTRHSLVLLRHFGLARPLLAFHDHNEQRMTPDVVRRIAAGEEVALIADAGTPLISDPGYRLVRALREKGLRVVPIPGASALTCALSVAGLPTDRFLFEGFLPARSPARRRRLAELAAEPRTLVFFESPHRVVDTLRDMTETFGPERDAAVARELTKRFETVRTATLGVLLDWVQAAEENRKGELVLIVGGAPADEPGEAATPEEARVLDALLAELPLKRAVEVATRVTGGKRNRLYRLAVERSASSRGSISPRGD